MEAPKETERARKTLAHAALKIMEARGGPSLLDSWGEGWGFGLTNNTSNLLRTGPGVQHRGSDHLGEECRVRSRL